MDGGNLSQTINQSNTHTVLFEFNLHSNTVFKCKCTSPMHEIISPLTIVLIIIK